MAALGNCLGAFAPAAKVCFPPLVTKSVSGPQPPLALLVISGQIQHLERIQCTEPSPSSYAIHHPDGPMVDQALTFKLDPSMWPTNAHIRYRATESGRWCQSDHRCKFTRISLHEVRQRGHFSQHTKVKTELVTLTKNDGATENTNSIQWPTLFFCC